MANNLKALKTRIKTVTSTEKVTQAMKMITTSKFANSNTKLNKLRDYFNVNDSVLEMMFKAFAAGSLELNTSLAKKIYGKTDSGNTVVLVAMASDKGLCGAFNNNINKALEQQIKECKELGKLYKIIAIGKRAREYAKNNHAAEVVADVPEYQVDIKGISGTFISELKHVLKNALLQEDVAGAKIIHTDYISSFSQNVVVKDIIPFNLVAKNSDTDNSVEHDNKKEEPVLKVETDIETSSLERVFEDYLAHVLHRALLNSLNSEYAVRMITMDNASTNAQELIKKLTLDVNRTRQADVTNELVEIISGAEAV